MWTGQGFLRTTENKGPKTGLGICPFQKLPHASQWEQAWQRPQNLTHWVL